jgi:hypothetical protein
MKFGEKLRKEGSILSGNGEDTKAPRTFGRADNGPSNLTLPTRTRLFPSPKEGAAALVNGLDHRNREDASTHGMSHHGREHRIDE